MQKIWLLLTMVVMMTPGCLAENKHHHHRYQLATSTTSTFVTSTIGSTVTITPAKRDDMPALPEASTSYSYKIEVPNGSNYPKNPYVLIESLPEDLVFIVVGAIIGLLILSFFTYRVISYLLSNKTAKSDRELYFHNFFLGSDSSNTSFLNGSSNGMTSSDSSMWEKNSSHFTSNSSLYLLNRQSSLLNLNSPNTGPNTAQQGRSYRGAINNQNANSTPGNRGSMFISPILDIMANSKSNLELPLYNSNKSLTDLNLYSMMKSDNLPPPRTSTIPMSLALDNATNESINWQTSVGNGFDTPTIEPVAVMNSTDRLIDSPQTHEPPKMKRPPSQFLDDLINDIHT